VFTQDGGGACRVEVEESDPIRGIVMVRYEKKHRSISATIARANSGQC
jgi:hypothetical protein